tara:strand:+ start:866 stop:1885 length:1020 start_codon:yes stop_codon:yes gene_type:complete
MLKKNFVPIIDRIYTDATFSTKYGVDIFLTIIIITVLLSIVIYFSVLNNLQKLRSNWDEEKCNPINFPFIHIINPDPNKTKTQQITDNINECLQEGVSGMANDSLTDIYKKFDLFADMKKYFDDFVIFIQKVFLWLFNTIIYLVNLLLSIIQKTFLGLTHIFLTAKDNFNKMLAIMVVNFFISLQFLNMAIAFILNFATIATVLIMVPLGVTCAILLALILIVAILGALFTGLSAIPFVGLAFITPSGIMWGLLATLFIGLIAVIVLLILMGIIMGGLVHIQNRAKRFIAPTISHVRPKAKDYYKTFKHMTPNNRNIPLDEQIKKSAQLTMDNRFHNNL